MPPGQTGVLVKQRHLPTRSVALYFLAFVFLSLVVWRSRVWEAGDSFQQVGTLTLVLVPLLSVAMALPLAIRGHEVLATLGHRFNAVSLIPVSFYGNTVSFLTPAASGELLRPSLLERGFGVPIPRGAAVVLYERIFSMYLMCLTGLLAFTWSGTVPATAVIALQPAFLILPLLPMASMRLFDLRLARLSQRFPGFVRSRVGGLREAGDAVDTLWRSPGLALRFTVLSLSVFAIMAFQFWVLIAGTGEQLSPVEAWVVLFSANMAGVLSGLPLGLGATDAVMVALLRAYGVDLPTAGAITVLNRCLINLPTALLGLASYVTALRQRARDDSRGSFYADARHLVAPPPAE